MFQTRTCLLLLLALPNLSMADTLDAFLLKAVPNPQRSIVHESTRSVHTGVSGWIDGAQLRFQAEENLKHRFKNSMKNRYSLRVTPKYGTQRSAEQFLSELGAKQRMIHANRLVTRLLKMRYHVLIDFAEKRIMVELRKREANLLKAEINLNRALAETTDFDPEKLQRLILDHSHVTDTLQMAEKRLEAMRKGILADSELPDSSHTLLDGNWPLSPLNIDDVLTQYRAALADTDNYPQIKQTRLDLDLENARLAMAEAKTGLALDLIDLEYANDRSDNAIGVLLGFRIPTGDGDANLIDQRQDQGNAKTMFMLTRDTVGNLMVGKLDTMTWNVSIWKTDNLAVQKIQILQSESARIRNPKFVIGLKWQQIALNRTMARTHTQLLRDYIDVLAASGILGQAPLRNWIKEGQPELRE